MSFNAIYNLAEAISLDRYEDCSHEGLDDYVGAPESESQVTNSLLKFAPHKISVGHRERNRHHVLLSQWGITDSLWRNTMCDLPMGWSIRTQGLGNEKGLLEF